MASICQRPLLRSYIYSKESYFPIIKAEGASITYIAMLAKSIYNNRICQGKCKKSQLQCSVNEPGAGERRR